MARACSSGMPRAAEVENLLGVEGADGGAVAALDVVGVDLQLRLDVHLSGRRE